MPPADLYQYLLQFGDNTLNLSHRLSEWCGHGPVLEQDIALTNIALDLLGQARMFLTYAGEIDGHGKTEDDLAYLRNERDFRNVLLTEHPNNDFAFTIARQFFYDAFSVPMYTALCASKDAQIAAFAEKSLKESRYHLRFSAEWVIRLGDGTETSHQKMQTAVDELWMYTGELFMPSAADLAAHQAEIGPDLNAIKAIWADKTDAVLRTATLTAPSSETWMQRGGKQGRHSEHLGFMLAEMQYLQRVHPGATW